jgi:hypothetical protein
VGCVGADISLCRGSVTTRASTCAGGTPVLHCRHSGTLDQAAPHGRLQRQHQGDRRSRHGTSRTTTGAQRRLPCSSPQAGADVPERGRAVGTGTPWSTSERRAARVREVGLSEERVDGRNEPRRLLLRRAQPPTRPPPCGHRRECVVGTGCEGDAAADGRWRARKRSRGEQAIPRDTLRAGPDV